MSQSPHSQPRPAWPRPRRGRGRALRTVALAALAVAGSSLAGCEGEGGTEVVPEPAELARVSARVDTVEVGQAADPPLAVRVENSLGEAVEGVPVRFVHASGPGQVSPNLQVSNDQGVAEASFRGGGEPGTSRVRVDVPSATNVSSVAFDLVTVPAGEVRLEALEGAGQQAEVGSQLVLPFRVRVVTPSGTAVSGAEVSWELAEAAEGARLASDTTFTDGDGATENLLTLGDRPVDHVVRAWAVGDGLVTDTVRFEAAALTALSGPARLDSVSPLPLPAGEEAVLHGEGFGARPENVEIRVEGVAGEVLGMGEGRIRFRVPALEDRCLPGRETGVRALVRGEPSNGLLVQLDPRLPDLAMAPGDVRVLRGEAALDCLEIAGGDRPRSYLLAAGTGSRTAGATTPLRLRLRAREDTASDAAAASSIEPTRPDEPALRGRLHQEVRLRERALGALDRAGLGPGRSGGRLRRSAVRTEARAEAAVGDTLGFSFAVGEDLAVSCEDTTRRLAGVVRAAGERVLLVEDTLASDRGFSEEDWRQLGQEFDQVVLPTDSAYFGGPADLDHNGRVTLLFTPRVNDLTPRNAAARVGGFFLPLDLVDSGDPEGSGLQGPNGEVCPASNEGEVLYLAAPDPDGTFSRPLAPPEAFRLARSIASHELEHLLSAEQRLVFGSGTFSDLGTTWLQEGLAHFAEEVVGLRLAGLPAGSNLGWEEVAGDRERLELFNAFHLNNFARLNFYLLEPAGAPTLAATDPGGLEGLRMRGFSWGLVRWLADRAGPAEEASLTRQLSVGGSGHASGVENVVRAAGGSWDALLSDFLLALPLDDADLEGEAAGRGLATWNLRDVFEQLSRNPGTRSNFPRPFPLAPTRLPFGSGAIEFETSASTVDYFLLDDPGDGGALAFRLHSQSGGGVPASASPILAVIRLQ